MKAWMISVVGVIALGILLEIALPEGKTSKYVKGAFSLLVVLCIVAPLPSLFKKGTPAIDQSWLAVDESYVDDAYADYTRRMENAVEEYLAGEGYSAKASVTFEDGRVARIDIVASGDSEGLAKRLANRLLIDESIIFVT